MAVSMLASQYDQIDYNQRFYRYCACLNLYILNELLIASHVNDDMTEFGSSGRSAASRNGWMSEINPKTDTSIVNTDIGMSLYSFLINFEMFSYFRSLNCFDFRRLDSWQTVSSRTSMFLLSYSTISGRSDDSNIVSIGLNEFRSVSKRWSGGFLLLIQLASVSRIPLWRALYFSSIFEVNRSSIKYVCFWFRRMAEIAEWIDCSFPSSKVGGSWQLLDICFSNEIV